MKFTHNQMSKDTTLDETLTKFQECVTDFIDVMDLENTCIKEHDTSGLTQLLPLKLESSSRYEKLIDDINHFLNLKTLSKEEINKISKINRLFIEKSKENYSHLENAHDYSHRLMTIFFNSVNEINKYSYTNRGETKFVKSTNPVALSQNL